MKTTSSKLFAVLVMLTVISSLTACFTGIESTPTITGKDVSRSNALPSAEQLLADSLYLPANIQDWAAGRKLLVTGDKINYLFSGNNSIKCGDTLRYLDYVLTPSFTGDTLVDIRFITSADSLAVYPTNASASSLFERRDLAIPFTIDLTRVGRADSILRGREVFLLTSQRVNPAGEETSGMKYIHVKIISVTPGDDSAPLIVNFLSPAGKGESVKMTVGNERSATRNFNTLFSFANPEQRYSDVRKEMWGLIRNSQIKEGMTREEARLSIGPPSDVKKGQNGTVYMEQWTYDDGRYLIFEDGLLVKFRL